MTDEAKLVESLQITKSMLGSYTLDLRILACREVRNAPEENRMEVAAHFYWSYPEISGEDLLEATGFQTVHAMLAAMPPHVSEVPCGRCGFPITFHSKTALALAANRQKKGDPCYAEGYINVCKPCEEDIHRARSLEYEKLKKKKIQKKTVTEPEPKSYGVTVDELRRMPYPEYLKTRHWQELAGTKRRKANYRCEVCNASEKTNVHHRTYARKGAELMSDLIVLCEECHSLFHKHGKLKPEEDSL